MASSAVSSAVFRPSRGRVRGGLTGRRALDYYCSGNYLTSKLNYLQSEICEKKNVLQGFATDRSLIARAGLIGDPG
jgi:hypothetical protein